jgi:hypothetical protein
MALDHRLGRLATGLSAKKAALAFARTRSEGAKLSDAERAEAEEFEATLEAMFLMAAVDGDIDKQELSQLAASIQAIVDTTAHTHVKDMDATLHELNAKLARDGWKGRLDTLSRRLASSESRAFAFRLAAGVAFCDDTVEHAEAAAIDAFAAALQLTSEESQEILLEVQATLFDG